MEITLGLTVAQNGSLLYHTLMKNEQSLEKFSYFAREQFKGETKLWLYLSLAAGVIFCVSMLFPEPGLIESKSLVFAMSVGVFLFLYGLHLLCLFLWYVIIFLLLRWFPSLRKEKFSG